MNQVMSIGPFVLGEGASNHEISRAIDQFGLAVISEYLGTEILTKLSEEFEQILSDTSPKQWKKQSDLNEGRAAILQLNRLPSRLLPTTQEFFRRSKQQMELAEEYWRQPVALNSEVYVMNELPGTSHLAQDLHFDVTETFKVFVYLNNITADNGAFSCIPGSHHDVAERRRELGSQISYENRDLTRAPERTHEAIPIEGPAGTVIFFTTEVVDSILKCTDFWHEQFVG